MADATRKPSRWGKPPDRTKADRRERRFGILGNIVTLLLTCAIIVGGFMLPTLLYPYLDLYNYELVQLSDPPSTTYIYPEPVVLYPWNLYDEQHLHPLSSSQRDFLLNRGCPQLLVSYMRDHGMEITAAESLYYSRIVNAFYFLEPLADNAPGCYVLVNMDLNEDGILDFNCAVDQQGALISFILLSDMWDNITIESPIGMPLPPQENENKDETTAIGAEVPDAEAANQNAGTDFSAQGTGQDEALNNDQNGTVVANATVVNDPNSSSENAVVPKPAIEHPPTPEDVNIWSFAYVISREALLIDQRALFYAFRQIELIYESRYSYSFTMLLPVQLVEKEQLPEVDYVPLNPILFRSDQYLLYIYNLPTGERLVLYLNPKNLVCMGFSLLRDTAGRVV